MLDRYGLFLAHREYEEKRNKLNGTMRKQTNPGCASVYKTGGLSCPKVSILEEKKKSENCSRYFLK